jgi:hypothetical protein
MGAIDAPTPGLVHRKNEFSPEEKAELDAPEVWPELDVLLERIEGLSQTNKQLRELVAYLSVLVIKNVVEQKS